MLKSAHDFKPDMTLAPVDRIRDNIPINVNMMNRLVDHLDYTLKYKPPEGAADVQLINDVKIQAGYVRVLLQRIQAEEGNTLPIKYRFTDAFDRIFIQTFGILEETPPTLQRVSVITLAEIGNQLDDIVAEYYDPQGEEPKAPSLWDAFVKLFERKTSANV